MQTQMVKITAETFVRRHTRPGFAPLVPEVRLHLADEAIELWERTEAEQPGGAGTQLPPPFWAFAWAGGQALARYILDHPELVAGRRVLDVASGGGLVAIACALAGAALVEAVEIDELAVAAIAVNAGVNGVAVTARLADILDGDGTAVDGEPVDVVLAGDVCYSREMTERMLGLLRRGTARGAVALLGDPGRAYLPRAGLHRLAEYDVPVPTALEDKPIKRTTVWRVPAAG